MKRYEPASAHITRSFGPLTRRTSPPSTIGLSKKARLFWTLGNLFMMIGVVLLLYVGGVYAQASYDRYAARGDTDVPAPGGVVSLSDDEPAPFIAPILNTSTANTEQLTSALPSSTSAAHRSTVTRVIIPSINVDSKVVEVGWDILQQGDQQVAIWQVAKYAVGQHRGSANPGESGNIVLAGHVGGYGKVFKDLFYVNPGDQIVVYSNGEQYLYTVENRLLVTEEGVSAEQHAANAQLIAPTDHEMVTLVTCWPMSGPDKFTQRVVIQARPFGTSTPAQNGQSSWSIR